MYGYVYLTTNLVNGKQYIGQKKSDRFLAEKYLGSGVILLKAIQKYGYDNFVVELLNTAENSNELDALEIKYIDIYRKQGASLYNIADGGYTTGGYLGNTTKDKIWVNNGENHIMIDSSELDDYLAAGYVRGSLNTKGYVWVTKNEETRHIPKYMLQQYLNAGYRLGRNKSGKFWVTNGVENLFLNSNEVVPEGFRRGRVNISKQPAEGKKYLYKDDDQILVYPNEVDSYIKMGYKLGKHPRSSIKGRKTCAKNKGFRWLTNGVDNIFTNKVDEYESKGYILGRTFNPHSK